MNKRDKLITLFLSPKDLSADDIMNCSFTIESFLKDIKLNKEYIYTTQTSALSPFYYNLGYDIKVVKDNKSILMSDLLKNKEVRITQNWEKMLYADALSIQINK